MDGALYGLEDSEVNKYDPKFDGMGVWGRWPTFGIGGVLGSNATTPQPALDRPPGGDEPYFSRYLYGMTGVVVNGIRRDIYGGPSFVSDRFVTFDVEDLQDATVGPIDYLAQSAYTMEANIGELATAGFVVPSTTVAAGSNGVSLATLAAGTALNLAAVTGFPNAANEITIATSGGTATLSYTGVSGSTLTGIAIVSGTGTWTVATGGLVELIVTVSMLTAGTVPLQLTSAVGFPTTANIVSVGTSAGVATLSTTGVSGSDLTGIGLVNGTGSATVAPNALVASLEGSVASGAFNMPFTGIWASSQLWTVVPTQTLGINYYQGTFFFPRDDAGWAANPNTIIFAVNRISDLIVEMSGPLPATSTLPAGTMAFVNYDIANVYLSPETFVVDYHDVTVGDGAGSGVITDLIGYRMGLHVATGATATNVYGEVMDVLPTPAGGVQFGYVSSYDNAFGDKNLVGGWTGKPTTSPRYALDVQGAQVDAATLGMKTNPVAASGPNTPTLPAVGDGSIAFVKGTGGTNSYFLITYNDGGTPRYAMIQLNTATPTLSGSPSLPV